jgi:hypothetical protein
MSHLSVCLTSAENHSHRVSSLRSSSARMAPALQLQKLEAALKGVVNLLPDPYLRYLTDRVSPLHVLHAF